MNYYHLRYNVYEAHGSAQEKERWIKSDHALNDVQAREHLEQEHQNAVSIIMWKAICLEEFNLDHHQARLVVDHKTRSGL